ncbi:unnamed protein product [Symbiodinium sp. CCMP2592]|nr:unnamed protein product [Symbiodinium sp. CCMP2592]
MPFRGARCVRPFVGVVAVAGVVVLVIFVAVVVAATAAAKTPRNSRANTLPEGVGDPLSRAPWPQFCGWSAWVVLGLRFKQKPQVEGLRGHELGGEVSALCEQFVDFMDNGKSVLSRVFCLKSK